MADKAPALVISWVTHLKPALTRSETETIGQFPLILGFQYASCRHLISRQPRFNYCLVQIINVLKYFQYLYLYFLSCLKFTGLSTELFGQVGGWISEIVSATFSESSVTVFQLKVLRLIQKNWERILSYKAKLFKKGTRLMKDWVIKYKIYILSTYVKF